MLLKYYSSPHKNMDFTEVLYTLIYFTAHFKTLDIFTPLPKVHVVAKIILLMVVN